MAGGRTDRTDCARVNQILVVSIVAEVVVEVVVDVVVEIVVDVVVEVVAEVVARDMRGNIDFFRFVAVYPC